VNILNDDVKPLNTLVGGQDFAIKSYINEHIYMTHGDSVRATLKLSNTRVINDIVDWFGGNLRVYSKGDDTLVSLKVNEQALVYWALQYASEVEVLSPKSTVDRIKENIDVLCKKYQ
jgi:predicted DNA-binding transcriptional regulator YafY